MQGKSDTEKSFRIMDLLQRKDVEHHEDAPIELTCKRRSSSGSRSTSTSTSTSSRVQSVKQRHGREEGVSLLKPGKSRGKPSPPDSPPESPESPPNRNIVTPPTYPALISSLHHHHPHATFPFHGQFPHLGSAFPKIFGLEHPHWFGMSLESSKDGATLGHGHHTHPQINGHSPFLSSSSPNASPVLTNLLLHSHGIHRTPHNHLTPLDFSLWHGTGNATKAHGHSSGPSLIHPYPDPRLFDYAYPASTLLSRIACGVDCVNNSGHHHHSLLNGESKRKGGQIRFSNSQTTQLEHAFVEHKYQNAHERRKLAHVLGLTDRQVKTWFQNRRAKWRKNPLRNESNVSGGTSPSQDHPFSDTETQTGVD